jgi:DNA-binding response OmpR family regulator
MDPQHIVNIIVVEDNLELQDILVTGLRYFGHDVRGVNDGIGLDKALVEITADIVILDLGLPGEDGLSIAARLRKICSCGIVMVTARGRIDERVQGLESGADLYFVKPVDIRELEAAIKNLHRRISPWKPMLWRFNAITSMLSTPNGFDMLLTAQECILMKTLLEIPGRNIARRDIFLALNQPDDLYADKRLEAMISRLRSKLKACDPSQELPVRARHNLGYAFLAEAERTPQ